MALARLLLLSKSSSNDDDDAYLQLYSPRPLPRVAATVSSLSFHSIMLMPAAVSRTPSPRFPSPYTLQLLNDIPIDIPNVNKRPRVDNDRNDIKRAEKDLRHVRKNTKHVPIFTSATNLLTEPITADPPPLAAQSLTSVCGPYHLTNPSVAAARRRPLQPSRNRSLPQTTSSATATADTVASDPALKNIDARIVELIESEILDTATAVQWDDIAGLEHAKQAIKEIIIWPLKRPDLFRADSLRRPSKGVLLFGPPGTGKTLIARCIASQVNATFFSISASSLTSKWVGEGEKMVKALFTVARARQPSVIFIDEVDSLLSSRTEGENDASRRIKTEFLVQFDGAGTDSDDKLLVIGATNRPQELDEAARRRFKKRLYIPLPAANGRQQLLSHLLKRQVNTLSQQHIQQIVKKTEGYSGSDLTGLCEEAALVPIREIDPDDFDNAILAHIRPLTINDFLDALTQIRSSVLRKDVAFHELWNNEFGSRAYTENDLTHFKNLEKPSTDEN